ncbi:MAG: TRAP transporter small permease subunit [Prochlorococcus sp.]|nr:TRAP transporter small permease subunit [Prochlorococcaceae cyanobacterium ETNP18_MAG_14]MDP6310263.1 TRAP transporter small permease subunit [Prochlorococcaceae cyanobacterium ETNP14_MAG_4]
MSRWLFLADRLDAVNRAVAIVARWAVLLMLGLGLWNVVGRYLGVSIGHNLSSNALIEGQWYLFDLVFLLGLGWTLQRQGHVRVDVLQSRWGPRRQARLELLGTLIFLLPFALGVMAISIEPALQSWSIGEASPDPNGLPRYWVKALIPLGFLLLALQGLAEAIRAWAQLKAPLTRHSDQKGSAPESALD